MTNFSNFYKVLAFYALLTYIICPTIFYFFFGKTILAAGNGFVVGSIASIMLWFFAGRKMALKR